MAEHRAATNALLEHFLVRGDQHGTAFLSLSPSSSSEPSPLLSTSASRLPSSAHLDFPMDRKGLLSADEEVYQGVDFAGRETVVESSRSRARVGREKGAVRTTAL